VTIEVDSAVRVARVRIGWLTGRTTVILVPYAHAAGCDWHGENGGGERNWAEPRANGVDSEGQRGATPGARRRQADSDQGWDGSGVGG
jgi:hypothetical protein